MAKMRKEGVLFSLGLMLLALVVLSLAVLIFHNAQKSEEIIAKLAVLDRVYDLDTSIGKSLSDIFNLKSGISINITNNSISFEEILPNTNRGVLNNSLNRFEGFIEFNLSTNFSIINLTITNTDEMPLVIRRTSTTSVAYKHKENWSDIEVLPTGITPNGYSIFIKSDKNVSCDWSVDETPAVLNFSLEVEGAVVDCVLQSKKIDPSSESRVRINKLEDNSNLIVIKVENSGLLINLTQDISVTARTTIFINQPYEIRADWLSLYIDFGDFGVSKEGKVRII